MIGLDTRKVDEVVRRWAKARRALRTRYIDLGVRSAAWAGGPRTDHPGISYSGLMLVRQVPSTPRLIQVYFLGMVGGRNENNERQTNGGGGRAVERVGRSIIPARAKTTLSYPIVPLSTRPSSWVQESAGAYDSRRENAHRSPLEHQ